MALTEIAVRAAKAHGKDSKLFDEKGLCLLVCANGSKLWRLKYRFAGREKLLSLGGYPDVGLQQAREKRDAARKLVANGTDPSVQRKIEKAAEADTSAHRTRSICSRMFRYAVATGTAERDCTVDLRGALPAVAGGHFAAITEPAKIGELLRAIEGYAGQPSSAYALRCEAPITAPSDSPSGEE